MAYVLASDIPEEAADDTGTSPERVRALVASEWDRLASRGDVSDLATQPLDVGSPLSALDALDTTVWLMAGLTPQLIDYVAARASADPRWVRWTGAPRQVTSRDVISVLAASYYPVLRARTAEPTDALTAIVLNHVNALLASGGASLPRR
jgi:hypothetical protein